MKAQQKSQSQLNTNNYSKVPCDGCKGHHIKCDKNLDGCKNCSRRGIECAYLITRKRRGPKTKVESMMKLFESLKNAQQPTVVVSPTIQSSPVENEIITTPVELQSSEISSPMQTTPVFSEDMMMFQTSPQHTFPVYQDIYTPIFDTNIYGLPLPMDLSLFEPALTTPMPYGQLTWSSMAPQFQPMEVWNLSNQYHPSSSFQPLFY